MKFDEKLTKDLMAILTQAYDLTMEEIHRDIEKDINRAADYLSKEPEPTVMLRAITRFSKYSYEELLVKHAALLVKNAKAIKLPEVETPDDLTDPTESEDPEKTDTIEPGHITPVDGNPAVNEWK